MLLQYNLFTKIHNDALVVVRNKNNNNNNNHIDTIKRTFNLNLNHYKFLVRVDYNAVDWSKGTSVQRVAMTLFYEDE